MHNEQEGRCLFVITMRKLSFSTTFFIKKLQFHFILK